MKNIKKLATLQGGFIMRSKRKFSKVVPLLSSSVALLLFIVTLSLSGEASASGALNLPQTGQTTCYNEGGEIIACDNTGQDGDWQAGVPWPKPRFVSGTGTEADCMIDNLTGLLWPKNGDLAGGTKAWQDSLDYANGLTSLCGHNDWSLPNIVELRSLVNDEEADNAVWLNTQGFNNVRGAGYYRSSSTNAYGTSYAWVVDNGIVYDDHKFEKGYVLPVRALQPASAVDLPRTGQTMCYDTDGEVIDCAGTGQDGELQTGVAWPSPRFSVSGECVTDNLTGLMWTKDANRFGLQTWQTALNSANDMGLCGFTDWRLPNVNELRSVIDYSKYSPALPASPPFINVQPAFYWSSSTTAFYPQGAWTVYMLYGVVHYNTKDSGSFVWPVRSGQAAKLPPVVPAGLKAVAKSSSKIALTWQDNSVYETSYKIYRADGAGEFTMLKSLPADTLTYVDLKATGNDAVTSYSYYLKACNAVGCSANTPVAVVPFGPGNLVDSRRTNGVKLRWTDNSANEKGFQIYRKDGPCSSTNPFALIKTTTENATTFLNTGLASGTYSYKTRSFTQSAERPFVHGYSMFTGCVSAVVP